MEMLAIALLVLLGGITVVALFAAVTLMIPAPVEETRQNLESTPGRSLLLGLVNFIFFSIIATLLGWLAQQAGGWLGGVFIFLAGLILLGLSVLSIIGLVALANLFSEHTGKTKTPLAAQMRGGALLLLAALAPYIGWFIFTPLVVWAGLGAAISTFVPKRDKPAAPESAS